MTKVREPMPLPAPVDVRYEQPFIEHHPGMGRYYRCLRRPCTHNVAVPYGEPLKERHHWCVQLDPQHEEIHVLVIWMEP